MTPPLHVPGEPERRLLMALLRQAILDLEDSAAHVRSDARAWLLDDGEEAFGFCWVCYHLGLQPERVRARLLEDSEALVKALEHDRWLCRHTSREGRYDG